MLLGWNDKFKSYHKTLSLSCTMHQTIAPFHKIMYNISLHLFSSSRMRKYHALCFWHVRLSQEHSNAMYNVQCNVMEYNANVMYNETQFKCIATPLSITSLFIGPRCTWGPIYGSRCHWVSERRCWNLTDMTLTDKDTNPILTDNVNRASQGKVVM